jgi:hypothetical protein
VISQKFRFRILDILPIGPGLWGRWTIHVSFAVTELSEVGKLRRVGTLMVWHGFRISAISPLPAHQLSQKPESIVVL